jgi:hypothetical protein
MAKVLKRKVSALKGEDGRVRSTCIEPMINLTEKQELIQKLNWLLFYLRKGIITEDQTHELLVYVNEINKTDGNKKSK